MTTKKIYSPVQQEPKRNSAMQLTTKLLQDQTKKLIRMGTMETAKYEWFMWKHLDSFNDKLS